MPPIRKASFDQRNGFAFANAKESDFPGQASRVHVLYYSMCCKSDQNENSTSIPQRARYIINYHY